MKNLSKYQPLIQELYQRTYYVTFSEPVDKLLLSDFASYMDTYVKENNQTLLHVQYILCMSNINKLCFDLVKSTSNVQMLKCNIDVYYISSNEYSKETNVIVNGNKINKIYRQKIFLKRDIKNTLCHIGVKYLQFLLI